ncbi:MAG: CDP-diacylglycerol O-phosphatidyltransferase [Actinomycetota bacterium]|nr:CDP-diacylglycerol O-phosphatidyltransferase [Actinomycetota bacterium]
MGRGIPELERATDQRRGGPRQPGKARWVAWLVHLYTASGAVLGFLAARSILEGEFRSAFLWLFAATLIDASDGWLARVVRVREHLPHVDGARLDDLVDYLTYVFVPALLLHEAAMLPAGWDVVVPGAILLSSAYGFARTDAKSIGRVRAGDRGHAHEHLYRGFPSYWSIVALYLYAAGTPPGLNAVVLLLLCGLVFVPIRFVYPTRTRAVRTLTLGLCTAWGAAMLVLIWQLPGVSTSLLVGSLAFPLYYTVLSMVLHARRATSG